MTGPESQGGDDQDLDDRVIYHLDQENRRLKEELELVRAAGYLYLQTTGKYSWDLNCGQFWHSGDPNNRVVQYSGNLNNGQVRY